MTKIQTIIVDDELKAREGIRTLLETDTEIEILAVCKNGVEAIDTLNTHQVDLKFLDIQMPAINGFEVVNSIAKDRLPYIIFITAYDQFALKAFEVHAIDYILKPFSNDRFYDGLKRAKQFIFQKNLQRQQDKLKSISTTLSSKGSTNDQLLVSIDDHSEKRLIVKEKGKVVFVPLGEIIWLEAYDYYVKIHVKNHFYLIRASLKKLLGKLPPTQFKRIHKSAIINIEKLENVISTGQGEFELKLMDFGESIKTGRNYKQHIRDMLGEGN